MYPPDGPSVGSKRKSLSGFALPGASGARENPETALTDVAWTTIRVRPLEKDWLLIDFCGGQNTGRASASNDEHLTAFQQGCRMTRARSRQAAREAECSRGGIVELRGSQDS